ncbi:MAG: leucine--tRNA ligase, partial [Candidatus Micrarchaeota archaeon]
EKKWQQKWQEAKLFEADVNPSKKKFLITFPYPYLNGSMHVGHSYSFFRTDAYARYKRMKGFNVLFPQGFHATGEPIMGTVERLRKNDAAQMENFKKAGATERDIQNFRAGPEFVAKFWMQRWIEDLTAAGASIDWRRKFITTDLTPTYSRFIEWQYNTLRKKGFVVQGTHPVIWCPYDLSPTGDHDRYVGEGESPVEYTIIKFEMFYEAEKIILPCATLRPETLLGVTNLWLNPLGKYSKVKIDGETWLLSEDAILKLQDQQHKIEIIGEIDPKKLIGKNCSNVLLKELVPIYPAPFVLPEHATGIVMSVPAHAPYDYIALEDLKKNYQQIQEYALEVNILNNLEPISLIKVDGYGDFPAMEECKKMGIQSQKEVQKLEAATSEIYKKEFHKGALKGIFNELAGMKISDAKEKIISKFKTMGIASSIWEPTGEVTCRCMTKCHVKILENQWFLKFSDPEWKKLVIQNLEGMKICPEEARLQMQNTIDWLQNKACTRKGGLGTKLPWDLEWKVETLSDSTIYMAYYTVSGAINENDIAPEMLTDAVFDYIFLGKGKLEDVKLKTSLKTPLLEGMKKEFEYFYPVDMRNSGKDLVQNHLLFFLFHHAAIFRQEHQPRGISVNGYVNVEGEKMSKSKGNFIAVRELLQKYGADLVRLNITASGERLDDADWRNETLKTYGRILEFLIELAERLKQPGEFSGKFSERPEKLLESRLNLCIKQADVAMDSLNFRTAAQHAVFQANDALRNYVLSRGKDTNPSLVKESLGKITLMLSPFTPHFSEEIWHKLGNSTFCSIASYPASNEGKILPELEQEEKYLQNAIADIGRIIELTKASPKTIRLFASEEWKNQLLKLSLELSEKEGKFDVPSIIKKAIASSPLNEHAKQIPSFLQAISKTVNYYKTEKLPKFSETDLLSKNVPLLEKRFNCRFEIYSADSVGNNDPENK